MTPSSSARKVTMPRPSRLTFALTWLWALLLGALLAPMRWMLEITPDSEAGNDLLGLALVLVLLFAVLELAFLQRLARGEGFVRALPLFAVLSLKPGTSLLLAVGAVWLALALMRREAGLRRGVLLLGAGAIGLGLLVDSLRPWMLPLASGLTLFVYVAAWCRWAGLRASAAVLAAGVAAAALIAWGNASYAHAGLFTRVRIQDVLVLAAPVLFAAMVLVTPPLCFWTGLRAVGRDAWSQEV